MSKYIRVNGRVYKAVDGWADDAKKGAQQAQKVLGDIKKLKTLAEKAEKLAEKTGAYVSIPRTFAGAKDALHIAEGNLEVAIKRFREAAQ